MKRLSILLLLCVLVGICIASVQRVRFPVEDRKYYYWNRDLWLNQSVRTDASPTFAGLAVSGTGTFKTITDGFLTITDGDMASSYGTISFDDENLITTGTLSAGVITGTSLISSGNTVRITTAKTPASASDTGTAGDVCRNTSYIYVCTATDTWKRAALSTWTTGDTMIYEDSGTMIFEDDNAMIYE